MWPRGRPKAFLLLRKNNQELDVIMCLPIKRVNSIIITSLGSKMFFKKVDTFKVFCVFFFTIFVFLCKHCTCKGCPPKKSFTNPVVAKAWFMSAHPSEIFFPLSILSQKLFLAICTAPKWNVKLATLVFAKHPSSKRLLKGNFLSPSQKNWIFVQILIWFSKGRTIAMQQTASWFWAYAKKNYTYGCISGLSLISHL